MILPKFQKNMNNLDEVADKLSCACAPPDWSHSDRGHATAGTGGVGGPGGVPELRDAH